MARHHRGPARLEVPAALVAVGAVLMLWWPAANVPNWMVWLGVALQAALIFGTALWWGPLMANLAGPNGELLPKKYRLLMTTHWIRVAIITAYAALMVWMLAQSAWSISD